MKIPLYGQWSEEEHREADYKSLINLYIHPTPGGRHTEALYHTPGLKLFTEVDTGPIRALHVVDGRLFCVSGSGFYEVFSHGGVLNLGTLNTSFGRIGIANNGNEILLVDGTDGWIYTMDISSFDPITAGGFPAGCTFAEFMDGYFIVDDPLFNGRFHASGAYDGHSWNSLDFATAERSPDKLQGIVVNSRELWLIGENTSEIWWNAGAADFPFAPVQSAFSQWGCVAPGSIVNIDHSVYWLSRQENGQGIVIQTQGTSPSIISTPSISKKLSTLTNLENAVAYAFQWDLHTFYVLSFPSDEITFVFDNTTKSWFQWKTKSTGRHKSHLHVLFDNKHVVGDFESGKLYHLDHDTYTDDGEIIERFIRSPQIHGDDVLVFHSALEVLMNVGSGTLTETNPKIMMRYSDDRGNTWSNEYWKDVGAMGKYETRVVWRKLGSAFTRQYELKITDAVEVAISTGFVRATPGERNT